MFASFIWDVWASLVHRRESGTVAIAPHGSSTQKRNRDENASGSLCSFLLVYHLCWDGPLYYYSQRRDGRLSNIHTLAC